MTLDGTDLNDVTVTLDEAIRAAADNAARTDATQ